MEVSPTLKAENEDVLETAKNNCAKTAEEWKVQEQLLLVAQGALSEVIRLWSSNSLESSSWTRVVTRET